MRRAIIRATHTAAAAGCTDVAPEHLLLAVAGDEDSGGWYVMHSAGADRKSFLDEVTSHLPRGEAQLQRANRLSPTTLHVIGVAAGEADRLGHTIVGTQHVVAALAKTNGDAEKAGAAGAIVRRYGLTPAVADAALVRWAEDQGRLGSRGDGGRAGVTRFRRWLDQLPKPLRRTVQAPGFAWKVFVRRSIAHPGFVRRPYPLYRWLRETAPVRKDPLVPIWILTRHADVALMLKDPRFHKDPFAIQRLPELLREQLGVGDDVPASDVETVSMLFLDPPQHTRVRSFFARAFTPRMLEGLRGRIQQITDRRLDAIAPLGRADLIDALCYPLPVIVIAELLGFPPENYPQYKRWSDAFAAALGLNPSAQQRADADVARGELHQFFDEIVPLRKAKPGDDLLSTLLAMEDEPGSLSRDELFINSMLLLAAGHETTTNLIANGIWSLLKNPEQLRKLREDSSLIESAVEEFMRFECPVQWVSRVAAERMEINGVELPAGAILLGSIGAANRDPAVFPGPDVLDITRPDNRHLGFGSGIHFCLGAALARMEGQIAVATVLRRLPNLRPAQRKPKWKRGIVFRAMRRLDVRFDATPAAGRVH